MKNNNLGLVRWYQSMTMGNIVSNPFNVVMQVFESLFKFHTIDLRWEVIWLMED